MLPEMKDFLVIRPSLNCSKHNPNRGVKMNVSFFIGNSYKCNLQELLFRKEERRSAITEVEHCSGMSTQFVLISIILL